MLQWVVVKETQAIAEGDLIVESGATALTGRCEFASPSSALTLRLTEVGLKHWHKVCRWSVGFNSVLITTTQLCPCTTQQIPSY